MTFPATTGPLKSLKVIEFAGLAPVPLAGMILADFGASVLRIDKVGAPGSPANLARGKRSVAINLKRAEGLQLMERIAGSSDVLIEPFRPGVMEKMGLGPDKLLAMNERLIYARLSGFGQTGKYASKAGHDINYVALSGILSLLGRKNEVPFPPINLLGDFAGGSLLCVLGILTAVIERHFSNKGQIVDSSITDGVTYLSSFLHLTNKTFNWQAQRGSTILNAGAFFYETYETKDGKYMSVGALEPKFYEQFIEGLDMPELAGAQWDKEKWDHNKKIVAEKFLTRTQHEWCQRFEDKDACVMPVLDFGEAPMFHAALGRDVFVKNTLNGEDLWEPCPAPQLSRHKFNGPRPHPRVGEHTVEVLNEIGCSKSDIRNYLENGIVQQHSESSHL